MTRAALVVIAGLMLASLLLVFALFDAKDKLAEKQAGDSLQFKAAREWAIRSARRQEKTDSLLKSAQLARADMESYYVRAAKSWDIERKGYRRALAAVNTGSASMAKLDSMQFSLYGPAPDDSTHTIPLDYSRKLTGDALRLPIEQRIATRAEERLDSAESHYGRMIGSMKVDLEMLKQDRAAAREAIDSVMKEFEQAQAELNAKDRKFRRQRIKERALEVAVMIGIIALTL